MTDTAAGKVPVITCVSEAWQFLIAHWRLFAPAAAAVAIFSQIGPALALLVAPADPAPQTVMQNVLGDFLTALPSMIAGLLYTAAILRKAVRNEFTGRFGLAFGADEVRFTSGRRWSSPASQASYPVEWTIETPVGRHALRAMFDAQELDSRASTGGFYWEGLAELLDADDRTVGRGYLEMTGYAAALRL